MRAVGESFMTGMLPVTVHDVGVSTVYAVVPARGGSKGIPAKNLQLVQGRSLVARAVAAARDARAVDRVFVSTEDDAIAAEALRSGAEVIARPADLASDTASSESALLHALDVLAANGDLPDILVMLQCTSPFVSSDDVDGTVAALERDGADCAFTVTEHHGFLWRPSHDGATSVNHEFGSRPRRQDRREEVLETGAVYVMRVPGFLEARHRFFGRITYHAVPIARSIEIDEPLHLEVARSLAPLIETQDALDRLPQRVDALILDFDGVLTDNKVATAQDGTETVVCDRSDGFGIETLRRAGVTVAVLSKERNPVVEARCRKLQVDCVQGLDEKVTALHAYLADHGLRPEHTVFVGNDRNDVECLKAVACGAVVADAHPSARAVANLVLSRPGGNGAVREIADLILKRREA
jgi:N-acylneuraminate cytidylyltransferase